MKKLLASLFLFAAILIGSLSMWVTTSSGEPLHYGAAAEMSAPPRASSLEASPKGPAVSSPRASRPPAKLATAPATDTQNPLASYLGADSQQKAMAAIRAAEQRGLSGAIDARLQLEDLCRRASVYRESYARKSPEALKRLDSYCDSSEGVASPNAGYADAQAVKGSIAQTRALLGEIRDAYGDQQFAAEIARIIDTSPDPFAVRAALEMAAEAERLPTGFEDYLAPSYRSATIDWRSVLQALSIIEFCQIGQGCGPGAAESLSACLVNGHCDQHLTAVEQARLTLPPNAFDAAWQISSELERRRASYGLRP